MNGNLHEPTCKCLQTDQPHCLMICRSFYFCLEFVSRIQYVCRPINISMGYEGREVWLLPIPPLVFPSNIVSPARRKLNPCMKFRKKTVERACSDCLLKETHYSKHCTYKAELRIQSNLQLYCNSDNMHKNR